MEEYVSRLFALEKSSDNTLAASTLAWLKMATEMRKMIKRVLVFMKFIFDRKNLLLECMNLIDIWYK
jgi:hypothetical protein